jgi:transcription elongation factor GreA
MSHSLALNGSRTQLISQLIYLNDEKTHFLDQYCPSYGHERSKIDQTLTAYSSTLEQILAEFSEESITSAVLIGSQVKLCYVEDDFTESYTIVFPHQADPNANKISFLSPIGSQLLMTRTNGTYQLKIPSGEVRVRVEEIKYMNRGDLHEEIY